MRVGNVAYQRQAQAASFRVVHQRVAGPIELLENLLLVTAGDADTAIHHFEFHDAIFPV
jgi:hypothetical protein